MIGLLATLIAAAKRHTVFAVFSGLLSVWNIYAYPNGEVDCNKFCSNCGNPIQPGQKYCPNCGKKVD